MSDELLMRRLGVNDSAVIADLHHKAFKNFFLTSLGVSFLRIFYIALLLNPDGFGIGIFNHGKLIGFAVGTKNNQGLYRSLIRAKGIKMLVTALPTLLVSPSKVRRLVISLVSTTNLNYKQIPCLLSICVSPVNKFKGLGGKLLMAFENELTNDKLFELILTTDKHNNEYVNRFYQRNGYLCVDSFQQGKREMNLYYKKLNA